MLVPILLCIWPSSVILGQVSEKVNCGITAKYNSAKAGKVISFGVLNAKALKLVEPEYPAAAHMMGVSGNVNVLVLIDPNGQVAEAKVDKGNPFLIEAAKKAALRSEFCPIILGDTAIWARGVIVYKFRPVKMNWLQLGLAAYSVEDLIEYLPREFDTEREMLTHARSLNFEERRSAIGDVIDRISVELERDSKKYWLFNVGRSINDLSANGPFYIEKFERSKLRLQQLTDSAPQNVPAELISHLRKILANYNTPVISSEIQELKDRAYGWGN